MIKPLNPPDAMIAGPGYWTPGGPVAIDFEVTIAVKTTLPELTPEGQQALQELLDTARAAAQSVLAGQRTPVSPALAAAISEVVLAQYRLSHPEPAGARPLGLVADRAQLRGAIEILRTTFNTEYPDVTF